MSQRRVNDVEGAAPCRARVLPAHHPLLDVEAAAVHHQRPGVVPERLQHAAQVAARLRRGLVLLAQHRLVDSQRLKIKIKIE